MSEQDQPPLDRIRDRLEDLSPNDRLVAEAVLRDPTGVAFHSADQLAGQAGVSKAAVVRFGARLGYGGFAGLQEALQGGVRERLEAVDDAPAPLGSLVDRWLTAVEADLRAVAGTTTPATLEQAAALLETGRAGSTCSGSGRAPPSPSTPTSCSTRCSPTWCGSRPASPRSPIG